MSFKKETGSNGFTLLEFLLVIVIFGVVLAVILPRALRAQSEAKFSTVRQCASEIASFMTLWAQNQIEAQRENSTYTPKDFFMETIERGRVGFRSDPLINRYTGDENFNGVELLIPPEKIQRNPFNGASYFNEVNDDPTYVPSPKPGLLYFVSAIDPALGNRNYRNFYLIFTGATGKWFGREANWYGEMEDDDEDAIRRGIFVTREPDAEPVQPRGGR